MRCMPWHAKAAYRHAHHEHLAVGAARLRRNFYGQARAALPLMLQAARVEDRRRKSRGNFQISIRPHPGVHTRCCYCTGTSTGCPPALLSDQRGSKGLRLRLSGGNDRRIKRCRCFIDGDCWRTGSCRRRCSDRRGLCARQLHGQRPRCCCQLRLRVCTCSASRRQC